MDGTKSRPVLGAAGPNSTVPRYNRAEAVGKFGPLTVYSLSRVDLIASKALGAAKVEDDKYQIDFDAMAVTNDEIDAATAAVKGSAERTGENFRKSIEFLEGRRKQEQPPAAEG
jgi:hypothetical protein